MHSDAIRDRGASDSGADRPTTFVVSSVRLFREGLSWQLEQDGRLQLIGAGAPDDHTLKRLIKTPPAAVALDLTGGTALPFAEKLRVGAPATKLIGFAIGEQDSQLVDWARTGVCGYVEEEGTAEDIATTVLQALKGELHCSPRFAARLFAQLAAVAAPARLAAGITARLTPRERQILREIELGASNKEIARRLGISAATVKNHVHRLLEKLSIRRRTQASALLKGIQPPI